jgi:hypothetical protein
MQFSEQRTLLCLKGVFQRAFTVCPHCSSKEKEVEVVKQYVEDIEPPQSRITQYNIMNDVRYCHN